MPTHKEIVQMLCEELLLSFFDAQEFSILFNDEPLQAALYDRIAPNFFWQLNKMYFECFFLSISRMLDSPKRGNDGNLSLLQLLEIAKETQYSQIVELKNKIELIKRESNDIRLLRNKQIAHRDLDHHQKGDLLIKPIELEKIKSTLRQMASCINDIEQHLGMTVTSFLVIRDRFGATPLLNYLKNGMVYYDLKAKRMDPQKDHDEMNNCEFGMLFIR